MWRWWSYALGRKEGRDKKDADNIALIRTILILMTMTTNGFIIAGVVRHWNDCPNSSGVEHLVYTEIVGGSIPSSSISILLS